LTRRKKKAPTDTGTDAEATPIGDVVSRPAQRVWGAGGWRPTDRVLANEKGIQIKVRETTLTGPVNSRVDRESIVQARDLEDAADRYLRENYGRLLSECERHRSDYVTVLSVKHPDEGWWQTRTISFTDVVAWEAYLEELGAARLRRIADRRARRKARMRHWLKNVRGNS
jgi:hypothetical protein